MGGKQQHTAVRRPDIVNFCETTFGGLPSSESLFALRPSSFRRRWAALLRALQIPETAALTPALGGAGLSTPTETRSGSLICYGR